MKVLVACEESQTVVIFRIVPADTRNGTFSVTLSKPLKAGA